MHQDDQHPRSAGESGGQSLPARQEIAESDSPTPIVSVEIAQSFSGPLPHPEILRGYDEVVPGAAERILKMVEEQAKHRQRLERIAVEGGSKRANKGMWLGFIISVLVLALSAALIVNGYELAGTAIGSTNLVSLAAVFVIGRVDQRRERVEKAAQSQLS